VAIVATNRVVLGNAWVTAVPVQPRALGSICNAGRRCPPPWAVVRGLRDAIAHVLVDPDGRTYLPVGFHDLFAAGCTSSPSDVRRNPAQALLHTQFDHRPKRVGDFDDESALRGLGVEAQSLASA
jgi:hypothetical protein